MGTVVLATMTTDHRGRISVNKTEQESVYRATFYLFDVQIKSKIMRCGCMFLRVCVVLGQQHACVMYTKREVMSTIVYERML